MVFNEGPQLVPESCGPACRRGIVEQTATDFESTMSWGLVEHTLRRSAYI